MAPARKPDPDQHLLEGLRAGDEPAFAELIDRYGPSMVRVAQISARVA